MRRYNREINLTHRTLLTNRADLMELVCRDPESIFSITLLWYLLFILLLQLSTGILTIQLFQLTICKCFSLINQSVHSKSIKWTRYVKYCSGWWGPGCEWNKCLSLKESLCNSDDNNIRWHGITQNKYTILIYYLRTHKHVPTSSGRWGMGWEEGGNFKWWLGVS